MNSFNGIGNLTRDPQVSYIPDKQNCIAKFTIAINRPIPKGSEQKTDFINCVAFGKTGEFVDKYIHKGYKVGVSGRIQTGSYEDKDGKTVYTTDIICDRVENLTPKEPLQPSPEDNPKPEGKQESWGDLSAFTKLSGDDIPF